MARRNTERQRSSQVEIMAIMAITAILAICCFSRFLTTPAPEQPSNLIRLNLNTTREWDYALDIVCNLASVVVAGSCQQLHHGRFHPPAVGAGSDRSGLPAHLGQTDRTLGTQESTRGGTHGQGPYERKNGRCGRPR